MATHAVFGLVSREGAVEARYVLDDIVREGARRLLQAALEAKVAEQLGRFRNVVDTAGRQAVVRNGRLPERELMRGAGPLPINQLRVRDHNGQMRFTNKILPPFLPRVPNPDALIRVLHLKDISTGNFSEGLPSILGSEAPGLSASNIVRLKKVWEQEYHAWNARNLTNSVTLCGPTAYILTFAWTALIAAS